MSNAKFKEQDVRIFGKVYRHLILYVRSKEVIYIHQLRALHIYFKAGSMKLLVKRSFDLDSGVWKNHGTACTVQSHLHHFT